MPGMRKSPVKRIKRNPAKPVGAKNRKTRRRNRVIGMKQTRPRKGTRVYR